MSCTSSAQSSTTNTVCPVFAHLEIYHKIYQDQFNKPSDPLILFYHYVLIHNRFKNTSDAKKTDLLPEGWNTAKQFYDLLYAKHDFNYRLEVYIIGDFLQICFKRLSDSVDILMDIRTSDYVDIDAYKNKTHFEIYRLLPQFYKRVQWSIDQVKQPRPKVSKADSINSISTLSSVNICRQMILNQSMNAGLGYKEIVTQIKQECEIPNNNQLYTSLCSLTSSCSVTAKSSTNKPSKKTCTKADLYVYNPITHYLGYNRNVNNNCIVDEDNQNNDPWVKEMFKKYDLKVCQTKIYDIMKTDFKDMCIPIKFTRTLKKKYQLSLTPIKKSTPTISTKNEIRQSKRAQKSDYCAEISLAKILQRKERRGRKTEKKKSSELINKSTDNNSISSGFSDCVYSLANINNNHDQSDSNGLPELNITQANTKIEPCQSTHFNIASIFTNLKKKNSDTPDQLSKSQQLLKIEASPVTTSTSDKENDVYQLLNESNNELDIKSRPTKRRKVGGISPVFNRSNSEINTNGLALTQPSKKNSPTIHQLLEMNKKVVSSLQPETPKTSTKARPSTGYKRPTRTPNSTKKSNLRSSYDACRTVDSFFSKTVDKKLSFEAAELSLKKKLFEKSPSKQLVSPTNSTGKKTLIRQCLIL